MTPPQAVANRTRKRFNCHPFFRSGDAKRIFVHGLHKSATMFLYQFFRRAALDRGLQFLSINNEVPNHQPDFSSLTDSFCLCPIRSFDFSIGHLPDRDEVRIVQLRDPRDILVSEYFSVGWIHAVENAELAERREQVQQLSIDEYVLEPPLGRMPPLENRLFPLATKLPAEHFILLKYETMIDDLESWIRAATRPFGFHWQNRAVRRYLTRFSQQFRPHHESLTHKRKMKPGDYLEKLKPKTIAELNRKYRWFLEKFNYSC